MGIAENIIDSGSHFDEMIKQEVAEDRKFRIFNLIEEIKKPHTIQNHELLISSIHHEIFSLKDSQLTRILNILNQNETEQLLGTLNESQVNRIIKLSDISKLIISPIKSQVSTILEKKAPVNEENYINKFNFKADVIKQVPTYIQDLTTNIGNKISRIL